MSDPFADYMHEDLYRYHHYLPEGAVEAAPYSPPFYRFEPLDIPFTSQDPMPLDPTSSFLRSPSPIPVPTPLPKLDESDDKEPQRFSIPMNMGRKGTVITTGFVSMFCDDVNTPQTVGVNNGTWKAASSCEDYLNEKGWQSEDAKKIGKKIGVKFDGVNQYQGLDVFRRMHQAGYRVRKPFASIFGDDWEDGTLYWKTLLGLRLTSRARQQKVQAVSSPKRSPPRKRKVVEVDSNNNALGLIFD